MGGHISDRENPFTSANPFSVSADGRNLKTWWNFDDFVFSTTTSSRPWRQVVSGTAAVVGDIAGTALRFGIERLSTGTTTTGRAGLCLYIVNDYRPFLFGAGVYTIESDIYITTLSDGTETYTLRFGFGDANASAPTDGAYFYYTDVGGGTPTPNWYRNTASNTTITSTDTGVAVVAGSWTRLKVVVNATGTSVEYFINDVSVGTNTTNIPTGAGRETGAILSLIKSAGTTARLVDIDWTWLHIDLTTSR